MPPLEAKENRIEDAIAAELQKIGVSGGASAWLTVPTFSTAPALANLPDSAGDRLWLQYVRTEQHQDEGSAGTHARRAVWHVWCTSSDQTTPTANQRKVKNLGADVQRAIWPGEGAITTAGADKGVWLGLLEMRPDLAPAGVAVGIMEITADFETAHGQDP
jgi:hypothetical protein